MQEFLGFVLAGFALAGSPGPATLSLAAAGAAFGLRSSLRYMLGLILGMVAVMAVTAMGIVAAVFAIPGATPIIVGLAAVYFAYLALRIATAPPLTQSATAAGRPSFLSGFILSLCNPKGYAAMAALFSGFILLERHPLTDAVSKAVIVTAILIIVDIAWLLAGAAMTRIFRDPKSNRVINIAFAILLLLSVVAALYA